MKKFKDIDTEGLMNPGIVCCWIFHTKPEKVTINNSRGERLREF